ncbi:glycosyltransferase family 4 protein [Flavobacteriaceae bacterium]|nr:glycosyltransferase family 4 protein [Flavobacteriaceae bacterium]
MSKKYLLSVLTSRRNYDVAKILHEFNVLGYLNTDSYYHKNSLFCDLLDRLNLDNYKKNYQTYRTDIPFEKVKYSWFIGVLFKFLLKKLPSRLKYVSLVISYKLLNSRAKRALLKNKDINAFYGYDSGCIETLEWIKNIRSSDTYIVLEQCIVPRQTQIKTFKYLEEKFNLSIGHMLPTLYILKKREEREWELADKIIAPSPYVYEELIKAGADKTKISIVPYGYQNSINFVDRKNNLIEKFKTNKTLKVIFVGNAGFRKGIHDFVNVAKRFLEYDCEFFVIGNIEPDAREWLNSNKSKNINFLGKLNKQSLNSKYKTADVFFFPSYLEGLAMVGLEALSWGLPTITTNESGSVIQNEEEGYILNAGDVEKMALELEKIITNKDLRERMAFNALSKSENFTHNKYEDKLVTEIL